MCRLFDSPVLLLRITPPTHTHTETSERADCQRKWVQYEMCWYRVGNNSNTYRYKLVKHHHIRSVGNHEAIEHGHSYTCVYFCRVKYETPFKKLKKRRQLIL